MKVVLAGGHLTDSQDREVPRFPEDSVPRVTAEVRRRLGDLQLGPGDLVICGGARGADIIVAEQALSLGAAVRLCLALPRDEFVTRSVHQAATGWADRFEVVAVRSEVQAQPATSGGAIFEAANQWMVDQVTAVANAQKYALVVFDGEASKKPGGAAHLAQLAAKAKIPVYGIDPNPRRSAARQWAPGPKKLLALDGGGIRGLLSLGILSAIEAGLRSWAGRNDLVLADYFDYIGGTSTGAIIASALCLGKPVDEVVAGYRSMSQQVFRRNWAAPLVALHPSDVLHGHLADVLGKGRVLGDPELRTLLLVVLHNSDTDSPWPLSNCPSARYNRPERDMKVHPDRGGPHRPDRNLKLLLPDLVRGSTAAPLYFAPERIQVGDRAFYFEDGGVTPYNNPALLLYAMATQREYEVRWPSGEGQLLVVSVGTGLAGTNVPKSRSLMDRLAQLPMRTPLGRLTQVPRVFMNGASIGQDFLCRVAGRTRFGLPIDNEVGRVPDGQRLFSYARYNVDLANWNELAFELDKAGAGGPRDRGLATMKAIPSRELVKLDSTKHIDDLYQLGCLVGRLVNVERHFAGFGPP